MTGPNGTPPRSPGRARRAFTNKSTDDTALMVGLGVLAVVALFALWIVGTLLAALLFLFAWNVGVGALVAAFGGSVGNISYVGALAAVIALRFVRRIFSRNVTNTNTNTK